MSSSVLHDHYILIEKIGSGAFGEVFLGEEGMKKKRPRTSEEHHLKYALKIEKKRGRGRLRYEYHIYKSLKGLECVPYVHEFLSTSEHDILVLELLGCSLEKLVGKFVPSTELITKLGKDMTLLLQGIHERGVVHRDVTPNNFVFTMKEGLPILKLIDFGLAKQVIVDGNHIPCQTGKPFIGTPRYASINAHNGIEISRRDDLESVAYVLIYLIVGRLPWQNVKLPTRTCGYCRGDQGQKCPLHSKSRMIGDIKASTPTSELCHYLAPCFQRYLDYSRALDYDTEPDYQYLVTMLEEDGELKRENEIYKSHLRELIL